MYVAEIFRRCGQCIVCVGGRTSTNPKEINTLVPIRPPIFNRLTYSGRVPSGSLIESVDDDPPLPPPPTRHCNCVSPDTIGGIAWTVPGDESNCESIMETQLQSLIDIIKREAVDEAQRQADAIRKSGESESGKILQEARQEAYRITARAQEEAARFQGAGTKALQQAARNVILAVRNKVTELFDRLLNQEIRSALSGPVLASMIEKIAQNWDRKESANLEVLLDREDREKLEKLLIDRLGDALREGVLLRPVDTVDAGSEERRVGKECRSRWSPYH